LFFLRAECALQQLFFTEFLRLSPKYLLMNVQATAERSRIMADKRQALLDAVKTAVSKYGVDGASTRKIGETAHVDDSYIYRFFNDREDLLFQAYMMYMTPMMDEAVRLMRELTGNKLGLHLRDCAGVVFRYVWEKLVSDPELCSFANYYYHSHLFQESAAEYHAKQVDDIVNALSWLFWNEAEAKNCIYALFTLVFDNTHNVVMGRLANTPETEQLVFDLLFNILFNQSKRANDILFAPHIPAPEFGVV